MASVQINIPGIGNVVADNAASEETLQKILTAMQGKGGAGGGLVGNKGAGNSQEQLKQQEKETEARKKNTKAAEEESKQTNPREK